MKAMFRVVTITAALACASVFKTSAQDEAPSEPPPVAIIHNVQNLTEGAVHQVQGDIEKQVHGAQRRIESLFTGHVVKIQRAAPGTVKSLVIRSSDMPPRAQSDLEEDMTIMAHILDKTLTDQSPDDQFGHVAMGINVSFVPGEASTRNLYLEGYGAVFFLNVNFPLLPPPAGKEAQKQSPPADSTWEEAREEVYGQAGAKAWASPPEYNAAKVAALKKALLDVLKNAANIRSVKSDELITVCVIGPSSRAPMRVATVSGGAYGHSVGSGTGGGGNSGSVSGSGDDEQRVWVTTSGNDDAPGNKTTLTIRVKKADCEAFASGKLTGDEFRQRASITIYGDAPAGP